MAKATKVLIDNQLFNSIKEAAEFLDMNQITLSSKLRKYKKCNIKDFNVALYQNAKKRKYIRKKETKLGCGVLCTTTGKQFNTITEAAKHCNVNAWTMGLKMEKAGKFIDNDNNEYIRLSPMKSKDLSMYPKQIPELKRIVQRTAKEKLKNSIEQGKVKSEKDVLKDVVKSFINNNKYDEAIKLISVLEAL